VRFRVLREPVLVALVNPDALPDHRERLAGYESDCPLLSMTDGTEAVFIAFDPVRGLRAGRPRPRPFPPWPMKREV
jgi:hypothetical protein